MRIVVREETDKAQRSLLRELARVMDAVVNGQAGDALNIRLAELLPSPEGVDVLLDPHDVHVYTAYGGWAGHILYAVG